MSAPIIYSDFLGSNREIRKTDCSYQSIIVSVFIYHSVAVLCSELNNFFEYHKKSTYKLLNMWYIMYYDHKT